MKDIIKRYNPSINEGLNEEQINQRKIENLVNFDTTVPTKSIKSIIISNFFTLFNFMNILLALAVFAVEEYKNMLFIGLVILNTIISTVQEIHSKKIIDKLSLISSTKVTSIRNGKQENIEISEIVLDDILQFKMGNQIVTDCKIVQGEIEVNESFITGEADSIIKKEGDMILSGSFVISRKMHSKSRTYRRRKFYIKDFKRNKIYEKDKIRNHDFSR